MPTASVASNGAMTAALLWPRRHAGLAGALARVPTRGDTAQAIAGTVVLLIALVRPILILWGPGVRVDREAPS